MRWHVHKLLCGRGEEHADTAPHVTQVPGRHHAAAVVPRASQHQNVPV